MRPERLSQSNKAISNWNPRTSAL